MNAGDAHHSEVRARYRQAATTGDGCGCDDARWGADRYDATSLTMATPAAASASMGCGNPFAIARLEEGEVVLDLGSGGGLDVIVSARRVGPTGRAYGVDFADEMLELARANAAEAGVDNVEFLHGMIEDVPLPDASVDVVISNCVVNLAPDKEPVLAEIARVLRPGGRLAVADVVADDDAPAAVGDGWQDCGAGALGHGTYVAMLSAAGFDDISIEYTHDTGPGLHAAVIGATRR